MNTIKVKVRLIVGLILTFVILGILNLRQVLIIEVKYISCISGAVLLLYLAAISFKISTGFRHIMIIKIWRLFSFALMGSSLLALLLLPFIIAGMDFQGFEQPAAAVNLGIILLLVFLNELMTNPEKIKKRPVKPPLQDLTATYFEQLPKITAPRKKPIYFEFD